MENTQWFKSLPEDPAAEIVRLHHFSDALMDLRTNGLKPGLSTGIPTLDAYFTVRPREWTLVTGIPSHGKSSVMDCIMVNMTKRHSWRWAVFSAENWPIERHAASLMAQYVGLPIEQMDDDTFTEACVWLEEHFVFISPKESDYTIDHLMQLIHEATAHDPNIRGLVVDPWNELDHSRPPGMSETEYVSRALTKLRRFTRAHEVHLFLVAHPTKLQRAKDDDREVVPTPYDVSGSAHFRNKADSCLCVWRDLRTPDNNETEVYIQKIRFREVGRVGKVTLSFDPASGRFTDLWRQR